MARVFITGAETGDLSPWTHSCEASVVAARSGMTGNYCLDVRSSGMNSFLVKRFGANMNELYFYGLIRREGGSTYGCSMIYFFADDGGEANFIMLDTTNYYIQCLTKYSGTNYVNSSPTVFAVNTTYRVEIYFKPSTGSDGRMVIKLNGTTVIDFTGVTSEKTHVRALGFGNCRKQAFSGAVFYYDDVIVDDANWITADGEQPHKVSGLVPTANGAVNDLDPGPPYQIDDDVARWLFESADLGNDEKGNADLTAYGSPATDSSDYRQGSSSVHLVRASSQYFKVLDSALPSNFPLKGGTANRVFTLCFWFKADTIPGSGVYQKIFAKENYGTDNCFEAYLTNSKFRLLWGTSATAATTWDVFTPTADKWYFVACKIHGDNRTWSVRVYDYDAGTWTTYTGTTPSAILRVSSDDLHIGCYRTPSDYFDGWLDNMRIYPVILTDQVLDLIRQNRTTWELYETVSVLPPNDNFFVKGHTDADIQTFAMSNLVGSVESVKCVQLCLRNFLTGAPSVNKVTPVVRLSGTNYLASAAQAPGMAASRWECKALGN